jgi:hypothetical protein
MEDGEFPKTGNITKCKVWFSSQFVINAKKKRGGQSNFIK